MVAAAAAAVVVVICRIVCIPIPQSDPPQWWVERSLSICNAGPDVCKEIPDMTYNDAEDLIFRHAAVHEKAESHQYPRQPGSAENEQAHEAEAGVGVATTPDVDQGAGKSSAQKG